MFTLARALQTLDGVLGVKPAEIAPSWNTPVQFDPQLVASLVEQYAELTSRFDTQVANLDPDPAVAARQVIDCAEELHRLRHEEALRLYPVIARGLSPDPVARRLFWQSRLVMLGIARRVFRRFDELTRAIRGANGVAAAIDHVTKALVEYRQRNESEIYPLYALAGRRNDGGAASAA